MKSLRGFALYACLLWSVVAIAQKPFTPGTWTAAVNSPPSSVAHMLLLTDGSVLVNSFFFSTHTDSWYRLIPNDTGSYVDGTWTSAGNLPSGYNPLYFASAVLPSGNVIIMGGEYNNGSAVWTTKGAMYNVKTNTWSSVSAPSGWTTIGDAQSVVLPNGNFMLANCCSTQEAILTKLSPLTWTSTGTGKADWNDEEGWTLLSNGNLLTVDAYVDSYNASGTNSEIYNTATGKWSSAGSTKVQLWDSSAACGGQSVASYELGPAVLRLDGTVFATGANRCAAGHTAIYHTATSTWSAGPDFPSGLDIADGPAALLPSGNVLLDTSPGIFNTGSVFFEWDGTTLNPTTAPSNAGIDSSYVGNMVVLPSGDTMFTDFSGDVVFYRPFGCTPLIDCCPGCPGPVISSVSNILTHGSLNNIIKGTRFNGPSQGAAYGDDNQSATNFPLIQITNNATGHVVYARSHSFSSMGVATGSTPVSAQFDVPSTIETGASSLVVVASGFPSTPVAVTIN